MLKRLLASKPAVIIGTTLAAAYVRLVYATSTIKRDPPDTDAKLFDQHPQILAMWHGQFLLLPKLKPKRTADVRAMVSRHGDAEIIGAVLQEFGMDLIRGRSEEHTSELQSPCNLVCRLLLEKKK